MTRQFKALGGALLVVLMIFTGCHAAEDSQEEGEVTLADVHRGSPDDLPLEVTSLDGEVLGTVNLDPRKGGKGFYYTPAGKEAVVFWQRDETPKKDVFFLSVTKDRSHVLVYSTTIGLLGYKYSVERIDTSTGELVAKSVSEKEYAERIQRLRDADSK